MMTLRQQMDIAAQSVLASHELGESLLWSNGSASRHVCCRVVEQGERQTVRRASLFAPRAFRSVARGHTFTATREGVSTVYRVLYSDAAETGLQRHICHVRLPDTLQVMSRSRYKSLRGADSFTPTLGDTAYRCKFVVADAEHTQEQRRRLMQSRFYVYVEEVPELTTDIVLLDSNGRAFEVDSFEQSQDRVDLPYFIARRSDA